MKLPSLEVFYEKASYTLKRFPFVLLSSALGAFMMVYLIDVDRGYNSAKYLYNIPLTCTLGISLFLSVKLYAETEGWKPYVVNLINLFFAGVLTVYYFTLPAEITVVQVARHLLFILTLHLLVSFIPFARAKDVKGFWYYNELLFIRILTSVLFSGVLQAGLSIAIVSVDKLFSLGIRKNIYAQLFFFLLGVFNTWFFLSGIPEKLRSLGETEKYPKGLKIFTQFVLLPLVTVYVVILYLYMGKIIIEWNLPEGWVSYLVLGFSIAGIFSILLIYPVRNDAGNKWINTFSKWFYIILFPLIVLLFLAITTRISDYGITENRYFVLVLALWLAGIAVYFTFSASKNIKIIPVSLCVIAFLTSFGPWGAFEVSASSQVSRLQTYLAQNNMLVNGKVQKTGVQPEIHSVNEIREILTYLAERNSLEKIAAWFDNGIVSTAGTIENKYERADTIMKSMGLEYNPQLMMDNENFSYYGQEMLRMDIKGYDYLYSYNGYGIEIKIPEDTLKAVDIKASPDKTGLVFTYNGSEDLTINILKHLNDKNIYVKRSIPKEDMVIEGEGNKLKVKMYIISTAGGKDNGNMVLNNINAKILIKLK